MVLIHYHRTNDPTGQFRMMKLQPLNELDHLTAFPRAAAEDKDLTGGLKRLGYRFEEAVWIRFVFASRKILRILRLAKEGFRFMRQDSLRNCAVHLRTENPGLIM